jgi:nicotinamide riboside kinase
MSCARPQSFVHRQEVIAVARQKHRLVLVDNPPMPGGPPARRASGDTGGNANEIDIVLAPETDLNLLLSTDLLWANADLAEVRRQEARDAEIRSVLHSRAIGFEVVAGSGPSRLNHALAAVEHLLDASARQLRIKDRPRWRWVCARCDDGECEQHWLARRG